ncbi:hypothetical protein MYSE111917_24065 [Mycobacterium senriense]
MGWSKISVGERVRPVAIFSRLRSSTAVSESNPRSPNASSALTSAELWPSTVAALLQTNSTNSLCRCSAVMPSSRARSPVRDTMSVCSRTRRAGRVANWLSSGGSVSLWCASAARSSRVPTTIGCSVSNAASNSSSACRVDNAVSPALLILALSRSPRCRVIVEVSSHIPQATESPGSPRARRCTASASRKLLAAA